MNKPLVVISLNSSAEIYEGILEVLGDIANIVFLKDTKNNDRLSIIESADAIITLRPDKELSDNELMSLEGKFLQSFTSGIDFFPFEKLPNNVLISHNGGAFAEPIAEYTLGVSILMFRELLTKHNKLINSDWDQFTPTRMLKGSNCLLIGYGGIGRAISRLMKPLGVNIYAVNRSGSKDNNVDFMGTLNDLEVYLNKSDIVVVCLGLNSTTKDLINKKLFSYMKKNALLINVARGEIINQEDLYGWLSNNPEAKACIDAWWREPIENGDFKTEFPFFSLKNFFGSPHNSGIVINGYKFAAIHAATNVRSYLEK
ncbi:hydroxyacid dehydrogenase, partial [Alphaproteobacteria bacterium]|nr:hydroxyacid dehydrogenase [Alphaproteobacteria bacterium]